MEMGEITAFNPAALKKARSESGLSLEALHEKSGVALNTINLLEMGRIDGPRTGTIAKLANALGVEFASFFAPNSHIAGKTSTG